MESFKKTTFDNDLRLILVPKKDSLATTVLVLVEAGSKYETKEINGLSHFLEHMCFKGTKKRPTQLAISSELDSLGAEYNAFTSKEYTGYFAKARNNDFDKILEVVSDIYLNPVFDPKEIDKERGPIIEEMNMYNDLPMRRVQELFLELVYGDQPAGWSIIGTKENLHRLQRDDFLKYRREHYVAKATMVIVAGGFEERDVEKKIEKAFSDLRVGDKASKAPVEEFQKKQQSTVLSKKSDQTHLVLGFRAFDIHDDRRFALEILGDVLGGGISSRLFQRVRTDLGAAYYVNAGADLYTDHGLFLMSAGVDHKKAEIVVKASLEEFSKLTKEKVEEGELQRAKNHLTGHLFLSLETSDELGLFYGIQEVMGTSLAHPNIIADKIKAVTAEELQRVAQGVFKNDRLNFAAVGPLENKNFVDILRV